MYSRLSEPAEDGNVGPGSYDPSHMKTRPLSPSPSFGLRSAIKSATADYPGPGEYSTVKPNRDGPAFTMYPRTNASLDSSTPGPGEYDTEKPSDSRRVSIHGRLSGLSDPEIPGPGAYNTHATFDGKMSPAFSFGLRTSSPSSSALGPGEYEAHFSNKPSSPSFTFGAHLENMTAKSLEALPGPGAYSSFTNDAYNPSFTMGTRLAPAKGSGSPGPGEYNVMDNVVFTEMCPERAFSQGTGASQFIAREFVTDPTGIRSHMVR